MKIIDLFNDMNNKKPLPNKIKLQCINGITKDNCIYEFNPILETYINEESELLEDATHLVTLLNLEVEILEEEKKTPAKWNELSFTTMKKIEDSIDEDVYKVKGYIETIMRKQNEVIDYLKNKGE